MESTSVQSIVEISKMKKGDFLKTFIKMTYFDQFMHVKDYT